MFNEHIAMELQIKGMCPSTLYHVRNTSAIRQLISQPAAAQLIHSLGILRLDYCNSLLYEVPECNLKQLQRAQNTAARVITCTRCSPLDHSTQFLISVHWLPIKYRILLIFLLLMYKRVHHLVPEYLCSLGVPKKQPRPSCLKS